MGVDAQWPKWAILGSHNGTSDHSWLAPVQTIGCARTAHTHKH